MIVVTTPDVPGMRVVQTFGMVRGNTIRARHVGRFHAAGLRRGRPHADNQNSDKHNQL